MNPLEQNRFPPRSFYEQETKRVAQQIIGCYLKSLIGGTLTGGLIVESEAYLPAEDSACHGVRGRTKSNAAMFGPAGRAYVYPIHAGFCFNIVTQAEDQPTAVLVRSLHPIFGLETMAARRNMGDPRKLTTGPSRLCQALGINRDIDHLDLTIGQSVWLEKTSSTEQAILSPNENLSICQTERIGVTSAKSEKLRYAVRNNPFVSGPKRLRT